MDAVMMVLLYPFTFLAGCVAGAYAVWLKVRERVQFVDMFRSSEKAVFMPLEGPAQIVSMVRPPSFGRPQKVLYVPVEWEEPLRCSGPTCQIPKIEEGQAIWLIPLEDGSGEMIWCTDCVPVTVEQMEIAG